MPTVTGRGDLFDALTAINDAVTAALDPLASGQTDPDGNPQPDYGQVLIGWPTAAQIAEILNQPASQISIYPMPGARNVLRYRPQWRPYVAPNPQISATVAFDDDAWEITVSGVAQQAANLHVLVGLGPRQLSDALAQIASGETAAEIALASASAVNALEGPASASADGDTIVVSGVPYVTANVAGIGLLKREIARMAQTVQIVCWCPFSEWRAQYEAAILQTLGVATDGQFIAFGDGLNPGAKITFRNQTWVDQSQSDYGLYESHIFYDVEVPIMESTPAYAVGAILPTITPSPLGSPLLT